MGGRLFCLPAAGQFQIPATAKWVSSKGLYPPPRQVDSRKFSTDIPQSCPGAAFYGPLGDVINRTAFSGCFFIGSFLGPGAMRVRSSAGFHRI